MAKLFERRLTPADSPLAILATTTAAFFAAMLVTAFLFLCMARVRSRRISLCFTSPSERCAVSAIRWCELRLWR